MLRPGALHLSGGDARDEVVEVRLHLLAGAVDVRVGVDDLPAPVAKEEGIARVQVEVVELEAYVLRQDVEGHHRVSDAALLGDGDDWLVVNEVRIQVGKDDLAAGGDGALIPFAALRIVGLVA